MPGALVLAVVLLAVLACVALVGPAALAAAGPHLAAYPRTSLAALVASGAAWIIALVAAGPVLAWSVTGPALVPGAAGAVCQQCLTATNPFSSQPLPAGVPSALLLGASALLAVVVGASVIRELIVRGQRLCRAARTRLRPAASIAGARVRIVEDRASFAYALPARCGGIVVSRGAIDLLDGEELRAVVAHEAIHVAHRHHLVAALTMGMAAPLRWVPFIAAYERTVLDLLEIDADTGAMREVGTTALVSALVKLQTASAAEAPAATDDGHRGPDTRVARALFALGSLERRPAGPRSNDPTGASARVRSLLGTGQRPRRWPTAGLAALVAPVSAAGVGVHLAGAVALLSGCAVV